MAEYTARDHAYVYGIIAQEIVRVCPDAPDVLREAITVYGLQRGSRMGQTADAFGDERTMQTYLAYGEWAPAPGEMDIDIPEESPSAVWNVRKCPWHQEWAEQGMLEVGKYYCMYVDKELVHGFHPSLELGIGSTQTGGDEYCYFKWNGADMTPEHKAQNAEISRKVGSVRLKTWAYHMGHIYKTMQETVVRLKGEELCRTVFEKVDERLKDRYGEEMVELMHAGTLLDYWVTPSCKKTGLLNQMFAE